MDIEIMTISLIILAIGVYLIPTSIAMSRKTSTMGAAIVVNIFLGWTFIGWVVALAIAMSGTRQETQKNIGGW